MKIILAKDLAIGEVGFVAAFLNSPQSDVLTRYPDGTVDWCDPSSKINFTGYADHGHWLQPGESELVVVLENQDKDAILGLSAKSLNKLAKEAESFYQEIVDKKEAERVATITAEAVERAKEKRAQWEEADRQEAEKLAEMEAQRAALATPDEDTDNE